MTAMPEPAATYDRVREFFAGQPVDVSTTVDTVDVRWASLAAAVDEITTLVPGWVAARAEIEAGGGWPDVPAEVTEVFAAAGRAGNAGFVLPVQYPDHSRPATRLGPARFTCGVYNVSISA